MGLENKLISI